MKNYESPVVLANENLAEGVFAASGAGVTGEGNCWYFDSAWYDNNRVEEGFETWHVKWTHDASRVGDNHHSGGIKGYIYVEGATLTDVYVPGWDNDVKEVRVENGSTIYFDAGNEYHYTNAGPEPKTFNICIKSNTPEESALLKITSGSMISCAPCNQHPNG